MVQIKGGETGAIVRERLIILILTLLKENKLLENFS